MAIAVYSIPESICRNFPGEIPGRPDILIQGCGPLCPTQDEATSSTFVFTIKQRKICFHWVGPCLLGPSVPQSKRLLLFLLLYNNRRFGELFDSDLRRIKAFLREIGAQHLGYGWQCYQTELVRACDLLGIEPPDGYRESIAMDGKPT